MINTRLCIALLFFFSSAAPCTLTGVSYILVIYILCVCVCWKSVGESPSPSTPAIVVGATHAILGRRRSVSPPHCGEGAHARARATLDPFLCVDPGGGFARWAAVLENRQKSYTPLPVAVMVMKGWGGSELS